MLRCVDSIQNSNSISIQPIKLNLKAITFTNVDFRISGTILYSKSSLQFTAVNVTIVDYSNNNAGFIFDVHCQTALSDDAKTGEILFDSIKFTIENSTASKIREDSFIRFNGHQNFTIQNSNLSFYYNSFEEANAFHFSDEISWAATDSLLQNIIIKNNIITFNSTKVDIYNDFAINYFGNGNRNIEIYVQNNSFINMLNSVKSLFDIEFYATGKTTISSNFIANWSSILYLFILNSDGVLIFENNIFQSWITLNGGFLHTEGARNIQIKNITIQNSKHGGSMKASSFLKIDVRFKF